MGVGQLKLYDASFNGDLIVEDSSDVGVVGSDFNGDGLIAGNAEATVLDNSFNGELDIYDNERCVAAGNGGGRIEGCSTSF